MNALDHQVSGDYYRTMAIQPVEYITRNKLPFLEANVVKYVTRWRRKNGRQDLQKAIHCLELLIQFYDEELQAAKEKP